MVHRAVLLTLAMGNDRRIAPIRVVSVLSPRVVVKSGRVRRPRSRVFLHRACGEAGSATGAINVAGMVLWGATVVLTPFGYNTCPNPEEVLMERAAIAD